MSGVVFSIPAPEAKEVYVVGDFNRWQLSNENRMALEGGTWRKSLNLAKGRYHYRFVIDGKWIEDPANPVQELNPYGSMDSLIEV
jgi:1,4-alpha-glucan branching enzyme